MSEISLNDLKMLVGEQAIALKAAEVEIARLRAELRELKGEAPETRDDDAK